MSSVVLVLTVVGVLGSAVVGGIFYAFSGFVMSALRRMPAAQGMAAMQSINITAVRAPLMLAMFGTAAVSVALFVFGVVNWSEPYGLWLVLGAVLYLLGSIVSTMVYHVPMNNALAALDPTAAGSEPVWADYQRRWTAGNHVRFVVPAAAALLFVVALLV